MSKDTEQGNNNSMHQKTTPTLEDALDLALDPLGDSKAAIFYYLKIKNAPLDTPILEAVNNDSRTGLDTKQQESMEKISSLLEEVLGEGHHVVTHLILNAIKDIFHASQSKAAS